MSIFRKKREEKKSVSYLNDRLKKIIALFSILVILETPTLNFVFAEESKVTSEEDAGSEDITEKLIDVGQCVEIAGTDTEGYYLKFKDDLDEKLQKIYDQYESKYQAIGIYDISTLKKMIKAEVATTYPSLGGVVESSDPIATGGGSSGGGSSGGGGSSTIAISNGDVGWPLSNIESTIGGASDFGVRYEPLGSSDHDGLDLHGTEGTGTPILAIADGEVVTAQVVSGYGNAVKIWHEKLQVYSFYAHMGDGIPVSAGQKIKKGEVVGYQSGTREGGDPDSYPSHLHFGMHSANDDRTNIYKNDSSIDPLEFLEKAGVIKTTVKLANTAEESLTDDQLNVIEPGDGVTTSTITVGGGGSSSTSSGGKVSQNQNATITIKENQNDFGGDESKFNGSINIRRLTPNKQIGEYNNSLDGEAVSTTVEKTEGMGIKSEIPLNVRLKMQNASASINNTIKYDELAYLTIPYIDYYENICQGHMIVRKEIADDLLNIFYELYNEKYPIARMEIVDNFYSLQTVSVKNANAPQTTNTATNTSTNTATDTKNNTVTNTPNSTDDGYTKIDDSEDGSDKKDTTEETTKVSNVNELGKASANNNNTVCYYYDTANLSNHATANAVDINPMINPKVTNGTTDQYNASDYVDRSKHEEWNDDAKASYIDKETNIYKIFESYGWTWGGDNGDYGHFEKVTTVQSTTEDVSIDSRYYDLSYVAEKTFNSYVASGDKRALYVFTLNSNMEIVTASWNYDSKSGFRITKGKALNFQKALSKYSMPFEYLSIMLMHSSNKEFVEGLAKLAMEGQYIVTVEDKVTTNKIVTTTTKTTTNYNNDGKIVSREGPSSTSETQYKESAAQTSEVTYVDCWYMKYSKDFTGNSSSVTTDIEKLINETGIKVNGTKTSKIENTEKTLTPTSGITDSGSYVTTTTVSIETGTVAYEYKTGQEHVGGNASKFVKLYKESVDEAKNNLYIPWITIDLEKYSRTANLVDVTKYLFYQADQKNYEMASIVFNDYKPDDFEPVSAGGTSTSGNLNITGGTVEEMVWNALKSAGYSEIAVAGAMGNIYGESSFNPGIVEGGSGIGFGLCQWSFGRRTQLEEFAAARGKDASDATLQIEFLLAELSPEGGADGYASYQFGGHEEERNTWMTTTDIAEATTAFCAGFERPSVPRNETRIEAAQGYLNVYGGKI